MEQKNEHCKMIASLNIGDKVVYLGVCWIIVEIRTSPYFNNTPYIRLERINSQGAFEAVEVKREAWSLIAHD